MLKTAIEHLPENFNLNSFFKDLLVIEKMTVDKK